MPRHAKALIFGLSVAALGVLIGISPLGRLLEESLALDLLFKLRGPKKPPSEVVLVTIDNTSADSFKLPAKLTKWPRGLHAQLVEVLRKMGAAVIVFDIVFDEPGSPDQDSLFAAAIEKAGNVVLCDALKSDIIPISAAAGANSATINAERLVQPIPRFARLAAATAPFLLPKVPVRVNQYWTYKETVEDKATLPVAAFQIYCLGVYDRFIRLLRQTAPLHAGRLPKDSEEVLESGGVDRVIKMNRAFFADNPSYVQRMIEKLATSQSMEHGLHDREVLLSLLNFYARTDSSLYLNFYGPPGTFTTVPFYRLVKLGEQPDPKHSLPDMRGKAVFVGLSELLRPEQKDGFYTVYSQSNGVNLSGVEIAATAFANLLENMPVEPLPAGLQIAVIFSWGVILALLCRYCSATAGALLAVFLSLSYLFIAEYQFKTHGTWSPIAVPLFIETPLAYLGALIWKYLETNKERRNIRQAFKFYLPESEVDRIATNLVNIKTNNREVHGTCLITDITEYTRLSESIEPRELSSLMNEYYEVTCTCVKDLGGIVTDVMGDCMLAIWTGIDSTSASREHACQAAIEINRALHRFNQSSGVFKLSIRTGLHSGKMSIGNIGGADHYEYTPIGDVVNTASRIESLNKFLNTKILVSELTIARQDPFLTREVGTFVLFGKSKPVVIHELICRLDESSEEQRRLCRSFAGALSAYRDQRWDDTQEALEECLHLFPDDGPSHFYLDQCRKQRCCTLDKGWNGLVSMDVK